MVWDLLKQFENEKAHETNQPANSSPLPSAYLLANNYPPLVVPSCTLVVPSGGWQKVAAPTPAEDSS